MTIELKVPGARALIEPGWGGRLHQLFIEIDGVEEPLLVAPDEPGAYATDPLWGGCYPMAPWPNRVRDGRFRFGGRVYAPDNGRDHALHGLVVDRPWDVVARVGRVVELTCAFGEQWPWGGRAWQRIELGSGWLAMKLEVRAERDAFPAGCGWHPWFRRDVAGSSEVRLATNATRRYSLEGHLPAAPAAPIEAGYELDGRALGDRRLDDCYTGFDGAAQAVLGWDRVTLRLEFPREWAHLQVYSPREALCVEPQTCAPDAFNLAVSGLTGDGTTVVAPGRPLSFASRWTWSVGAP